MKPTINLSPQGFRLRIMIENNEHQLSRTGKLRRISGDFHPGECAHVVTARTLNSWNVIHVMVATKSEANASAIGILEKITHDARRR